MTVSAYVLAVYRDQPAYVTIGIDDSRLELGLAVLVSCFAGPSAVNAMSLARNLDPLNCHFFFRQE